MRIACFDITSWSGTDTLTLPIDPVDTTYGTVYTPVSVTPGVLNELHLSVDYISAGRQGIRLAAFEESAGTYKELGSTIIAGGRGDYKLLFTPTGAEVHLTLVNMSTTQLAFLHLGEAHLLTTTTTTPITVYETVCNGDKDRYRFGFNGQMKDNDWAGIGNHLDFKFRGYDSRTGRFISKDPLYKDYPWNSNYAFAENDVIRSIDIEGKEKYIVILAKYNSTPITTTVTFVPLDQRISGHEQDFAYFVTYHLEKTNERMLYNQNPFRSDAPSPKYGEKRQRNFIVNGDNGRFVSKREDIKDGFMKDIELPPYGYVSHTEMIPNVIVRYDPDKVNFSEQITDRQKSILSDFKNMLSIGIIKGLRASGHTSNIDTKYKSNVINKENNNQLSIDRAQAGTDYLTNEIGVDPSKIQTVGVGSTEPSNGKSPDDQSNQRTEINPVTN